MATFSKEQLPILSPWGKAAAGALAAMMANALVYPLDLAKTRLQVQMRQHHDDDEEYYHGVLHLLRHIYKKDGYKGIYKGLYGTLFGVAFSNFAYFYWYSLIRGFYKRKKGIKSLTTAIELLLGAIAGALSQLFTIPVGVITTRQQTSKEHVGFFAAGKQVVRQNGITGLWRGLKASLVLTVNPSITYGSSARIRTLLFDDREHLSVRENFLLGAFSKSMATIATQPLIVAKVMQQSSNHTSASEEDAQKTKKNLDISNDFRKPTKPEFHTFLAALTYLYKYEGILGLFKGIGPQISKGIIVQGLLLAIKDKVELQLALIFYLLKKHVISRKLALALN